MFFTKNRITVRILAAGLTLASVVTFCPAGGNGREVKAATVSSKLYNAGKNFGDVTGVTNEEVLSWLHSHLNDDYYLGTPYAAGDYRSPNGDPAGYGSDDKAGKANLNCTGFVWHVLYKASGLSKTAAFNTFPCWRAAGGGGGWVTWLRKNKVEYKTYAASSTSSVSTLINTVIEDGYIEPGDIIWTWDSDDEIQSDGLPNGISDEHHIGFYIGGIWGDEADNEYVTNKGSNQWWHSTSHSIFSIGMSGNGITRIAPKTTCKAITVVKLGKSGYAKLNKKSANESVTKDNSCYSLEGAVYGVYKNEGCTSLLDTLTTDEEGNTETIALPKGTYYVKELQASKGYLLDKTVYKVVTAKGETATINVLEDPILYEGDLTLVKMDKETKTSLPTGAGSLENAVFEWHFYAGSYERESLPDTPDFTCQTRTVKSGEEGEESYKTSLFDSSCLVLEDDFYKTSGIKGLPLGTITVEEVNPSKGYLASDVFFASLDGTVSSENMLLLNIEEKDASADVSADTFIVYEQVVRGDFAGRKVDEEGNGLAGISFSITSKTTGESHTIKTEKDGALTTVGSNIVFGKGEVKNGKGTLPYDTYIIEELSCKVNEGYELLEPFEVTIADDGAVVNLGSLVDKKKKADVISAAAKTGDTTSAALYLGALILSCAALFTCATMTVRLKQRWK